MYDEGDDSGLDLAKAAESGIGDGQERGPVLQ